jgi:uncharacterized protein YndB with AHSA1/START domain
MQSTKITDLAFKVNYIVYGSPEKVFDAVTKQSQIEEWCEGGGKIEPFVKGEVNLFGDWMKGEVLKFNKIKRELSYSWKPKEWTKSSEHSLVDFKFTKHSAGTVVEVTHSNLPNAAVAKKHKSGWVDHFFEPLNDYFTR